jgi:hypothetical protein
MKPREKARDLAEIAADIRSRIETVGDIIAIGGLLREAKCQLRHGKFLPWLAAEFDFSERTAQNYMRAHKFATKNATVADLQLTPTALYALAEGYFSMDSSEYAAKVTADEVALVLKEAAEQRVTRERVEGIIFDERERKDAATRGFDSVADADAADAAADAVDAARRAKEEEEAARAEAAAILDAGSELPSPEPTAEQPTPREQANLTTFEEAIKALRSVMTKPASEFKPTYISAADLQTIAGFLQQVAAAKGASGQDQQS